MDCKESKEEPQEKIQNKDHNMLRANLHWEIQMQFLSNKICMKK